MLNGPKSKDPVNLSMYHAVSGSSHDMSQQLMMARPRLLHRNNRHPPLPPFLCVSRVFVLRCIRAECWNL